MNYLLTFETDEKGEQLFVHGDPEGLRFLAKKLEHLAAYAESGSKTHDHLMTEGWGGHELSSELQATDGESKLINHVVVYSWPKR